MAQSVVIEIGDSVNAFEEEKILILFGPMATSDLKEVCVIHEFTTRPAQSLIEGKQFTLGNNTYTITKVGAEANRNFEELGHISIYFKESENGILPGAIEAEPSVFPTLKVGDKIEF